MSAKPVTDDELAEVERLDREALAEGNAALKRVAAERDAFEAEGKRLLGDVARLHHEHRVLLAKTDGERDRVRRLFDHHLTGLAVDDDVKRALAAFAADVASGVDRRPA